MIIKNTFGVSTVMIDSQFKKMPINPFAGSSLNRKRKPIKRKPFPNELIEVQIKEKKKAEEKVMSGRTKSKIRKKIIAFSQQYKRLSFLTLTFVNKVEDEKAIIILRKFLDNMKKAKQRFSVFMGSGKAN